MITYAQLMPPALRRCSRPSPLRQCSPRPPWPEAEVTYEVVSDKITTADVRYFSADGIQEERAVSLPWRATASVEDLASLARGAEVHAKWDEQPNTEVTVRIFADEKKICEAVQRSGTENCNSALSS